MKQVFLATTREKIRRPAFPMICLALLFSIVLMIPRASGTMRAIIIDPNVFRQANNISWVPISVSFIMGFFLPLISAVYLRDSIGIDRDTGNLAFFLTTHFSKSAYLYGKFLSNLWLTGSFWLIILLTSLLSAIFKYGIASLNLVQFIMPFLILLPGLIFLSALTILTEVLPILRQRSGTVILVIGLIFLYTAGANYIAHQSFFNQLFNLSGTNYLISNIKQSIAMNAGAKLTTLKIIGSTTMRYSGTQNLIFSPIQLNWADWLRIGILIILSCLMVELASFCLENRPIHRQKRPFNLWRPTVSTQTRVGLCLHLMTANNSVLLLSLLVGTWGWAWLAPSHQATQTLFPLLVILATPIFSTLGALASQSHVYDWLATIPNGQLRQTIWTGTMGIAFSLILILPIFLKLTFALKISLFLWGLLAPLLSQLLGRWTASSRPTQLVLLVFCYLYLNGAPVIALNPAPAQLLTIIYLILLVITFTSLVNHHRIKLNHF
jgi:hypothetical protein